MFEMLFLEKTKLVVSGGIKKDGMSKSKVVPSWVCSFRVKANSVLCALCGKLFHSICVKVKSLFQNFRDVLHADNVKGMLERQCSRNKGYVMKWKL